MVDTAPPPGGDVGGPLAAQGNGRASSVDAAGPGIGGGALVCVPASGRHQKRLLMTKETTHVAACAARLALARRIDGALRRRAARTAPPGFSAAVLARVRRERWRAEQAIDLGFNVAIAVGLLVVVAGVIGLVYASGVSAVSADAMARVARAVAKVAVGVAPSLPA